uniref:Uncharacterized protein n=1 Tax=Arundo donax TaxID=35708 RepID=A0A0A8ZUC2_ARUDO
MICIDIVLANIISTLIYLVSLNYAIAMYRYGFGKYYIHAHLSRVTELCNG